MSGIAAVWNLDGRPLSRSVFDRVLSPLRHGAGRIGTWREGAISMGLADSRAAPPISQPLVGSDGTVLLFHGRLDDRHGLVDDLGEVPEADELMSDPALVLAAYAKWSDDLCDHLTGDFAIALFDPRKQWLLLARDPTGTRPLHYMRLPATVVVAGRIEAVLAHPEAHAAPNEAHLSRLVLGGAPQHDTPAATPFDGIHSVAPGHLAILARGRFATRGFRDPLPDVSRPPAPATEASDPAEAVASVLQRAIASRSRGAPVAIPMDGWGSGALLNAALRADVPVVAIVPQGRPAPAAATVVSMAAASLPSVAAAQECVRISESPRLDPAWSSHWPALQEVASGEAAIVLSCLGAEELLGDDAYLADLVAHLRLREAFLRAPGSLPARARHVTDVAARGLTPPILRQAGRGVRAYVAGPLRDADWYTPSFHRWAERASTREAPDTGSFQSHAARGLYEQARSAALAAAVEQEAKVGAAAGLEVAFPFLDPGFVHLLMAIPDAARPAGGDLSALLPVAPLPAPAPSAHALVADWSECVRRLTRARRAVDAGFVDGAVLRSELPYVESDIREGDANVAAGFLDLLGLELWLEGLENLTG